MASAFATPDLFDTLFELLPTGVLLLSPCFDATRQLVDFTLEALNPAGQRLLGLPAQPPHTFREYYPHSGPTGIFVQYCTAYLTGQASTYDVPYQGDGFDTFFRLVAQRSGELLVVNFTDMADLPRSAVEQALRDDRDRAQAAQVADAEQQQQRLEQQRATFYQAFELTPAAICIQLGPEHRFEYANAAYLNFFPGRDVLGKAAAEVIPEIVDSGVLALLDHVYQTGETYYGYELPLLIAQPQGPARQVYFTFTYQALRENGQIVGISTFAYNVAEQVLARQQTQQLHDELSETNRRLTRTNNDLDSFVYTASHDLKSPIINMGGLLEALREELATSPECPTYLLDLMQQSLTRFQTTLGHLTTFTHQAADAAAGPQEVNVVALVEDVRLDLATILTATQATLRVDIAGGCERVHLPAKVLRSIVFNLMSNALKYRAAGRPPSLRIAARCQPETQQLELLVTDNGLGLSAQQQGNLFKLFRRLHTHVEGAGVGLYSIKRLIDHAGGTITVESEVGVGSTFTVTLPQAFPAT